MKNSLLFSLFVITFISSCKKHDQKPQTPTVVLSDPEARNQEGTKLLGTSTRSTLQRDLVEWTTFYYNGSTEYLTQYTDSTQDSLSAAVGETYLFHYDNSLNLKSITNSIEAFNFYFNASGLIENDSNILNSSYYNSSNFFFYNSASQIVSYTISYNSGRPIDNYVKYVYDQSGNIIQAAVYDSSSSSVQKQVTYVYQYDNMQNPFYAIKYSYYILPLNGGDGVSPNNNISFQVLDAAGNPSPTNTVKYVYNSFNYPKYSFSSVTGDTTKYYYY